MAEALQQKSLKHPPGLYLLFATEMWERFSYYGMRGLLILFLTKSAIEGGLGIDKGSASLIYGYFTGFVYFTPFIGGWLADNILGQRRAILIGGILMACGQFSLASGWATEPIFFGMNASVVTGLSLLILGNGFFKPNISTIVGALYEPGDARRDGAFTIFYMGINTGALIAPLVCGYLADDVFATRDAAGLVISHGYKYGFMAAGIGMVIGQILFNLLAPKYLGHLGVEPSAKVQAAADKLNNKIEAPLTSQEKDRLAVIAVITVFVTFFWAGFEQAGSSLSLYTDSFINRQIGSFTIPTSWFQSVNPLFIILLGYPISMLWVKLGKAGKNPATPLKMAMGMVLLGIGFIFMIGAVMERGGGNANIDPNIKASIWWLVLTYFFHTLGELFLSPIGLSMITKLSPVKLVSMMMGVWFLSPFVAQIAGGYIAKYVEELGAYTIFSLIAGFVIFSGFILFLIARKLISMSHGAEETH